METSQTIQVLGLVIVVAAVLAAVGGVTSRMTKTDRRIARVERKIDLILDHLGLREVDPRLESVAAFLRNGKKLDAIKAYRQATGVGLKEARDAVERMI